MNKPRIYTILLFSLFFFLSSFVYATEEMNELMKHWQTVETALDNWQNADEPPNNTTAQKLYTSLEQFYEKLKNFTASLIFIQYEGTGLLPKDSGNTTLLMAQELTASVKRIAEIENPTELSAISFALCYLLFAL